MTRRDACLLLAGSPLAAQTKFRDDPFTLGIASGEPWPDGFVLWTRLNPRGGVPAVTLPVEWRVALDEKMSRVVRQGTALAAPSLAHSAHVEVRGLDPGRWYWYQFVAGGVRSPVGRTRTAPPAGAHSDLRFAFASCQKYIDGYYTAYRHMADEDIDLVVHLGDYIYETVGRRDRVRQHPVEEARTLEQYRERYALYKSDPDLQRAHAMFPWAVVWDDHETSDNYAGMIPDLDSPLDTFPARRAAAYQAYYEHMPLRAAARPKGADLQLYRRISWGSMAQFHLLDTRQYRSDQPCGDKVKPPCAERANPAATMLGDRQQEWLFEGLSSSAAKWNVLAQQVIVATMDLDPGPGELYSMDKWDGYPSARERLMEFLERRKPSNPVILSGDNHNNWVFDLRRDVRSPRSPVLATEFVGTSITSNGDGAEINPEYAAALASMPHLKFHNGQRGYVRCTVTDKVWRTDFRVVPYVTRHGGPVVTKAGFVVESDTPGAKAV
jgi:alkaline phosphatase D